MTYIQTWDLQKSESDWTEKTEAVNSLQSDLNDDLYISQTLNHSQFEEIMTLNVETQTLRYQRVWDLQSDCEAYVASNADKDTTLQSKLTEAGWTVTVV